MVFQNPGAFPQGTTWRNFVDNQIGSLPANPTIANVFYRRGTMEAWGRGIGLIMDSCREQGLPEPKIDVIPSFVNLTISFSENLSPQEQENFTPSYTPSKEDFTPSEDDVHPQKYIPSPQERVFEYCRTPRSVTDIASMLGVNDKKWIRKKYLTPWIGIRLELTIPDKPNSRNQKYRLIE